MTSYFCYLFSLFILHMWLDWSIRLCFMRRSERLNKLPSEKQPEKRKTIQEPKKNKKTRMETTSEQNKPEPKSKQPENKLENKKKSKSPTKQPPPPITISSETASSTADIQSVASPAATSLQAVNRFFTN